MFFYDDKPYKGTRPADLANDSTAGRDNLGRLMVWLCLVGFWMAVAYGVWP